MKLDLKLQTFRTKLDGTLATEQNIRDPHQSCLLFMTYFEDDQFYGM